MCEIKWCTCKVVVFLPFCRSRCRRRRRCLSSLIIFNIGYAPVTSTWRILFHFLKVILRKSQVESQIIKKNKLVLLSMDKCAIKVCCQKGSRDLDRCILKTISGINLITRYLCFFLKFHFLNHQNCPSIRHELSIGREKTTFIDPLRTCLHGGRGPQVGGVTRHGLPHLAGVPHLHVNVP